MSQVSEANTRSQSAKHIVLLVHGIRTRAEWGEKIKAALEEAEPGLQVEPSRYGYFDVLRFVFPFKIFRRRPIAALKEWLRYIRRQHPESNISVVAHSFGCFLLGSVLEEEPDLDLYRIILCGSVLNEDYPWNKLHLAGRYNAAVNECGWRDVWPLLAKAVTWGYGVSGAFGFNKPGITNRFHDLEHSEFLANKFAVDFWIPFLRDGTLVVGNLERPVTAWWKSVLGILPIKYLVFALLACLPFLRGCAVDPVPPQVCKSLDTLRVVPCAVEIEPQQEISLAVGILDRNEVFHPAEALYWKSDIEAVATVDAAGRVGARMAGSTGVLAVARNQDGVQSAARGLVTVRDPRSEQVSLFSYLERVLSPEWELTVIGVNDLYEIEGVEGGQVGGLARLRTLRAQLEANGKEVLLLCAGDFLFPSQLSSLFEGQQMIDTMNLLDGDPLAFDQRMFVAFGHHEFDRGPLGESLPLMARIEESQFSWLATNVPHAAKAGRSDGFKASQVVDYAVVQVKDVKVGILGITGPLGIGPSSFEDAVAAAGEALRELRRRGAVLTIAVTHLEMGQDRSLLTALGEEGPDLVIGGHEHEAQASQVAGRWILKADSNARTATVATIRPGRKGAWNVDYRLVFLVGQEPIKDQAMAERVAVWKARADTLTCARQGLKRGCQTERLARTAVRLIGDELSTRTVETNLGNWVADSMLDHFAEQGAQVAFINAGALRLDRNVEAGSEVTRRDLDELLPFNSQLRLIRIRGVTLKEVLAHAAENWGYSGHWLQIGGMAYGYDPEDGTISGLRLLGSGRSRIVLDDEEILAVTIDYLANGGDDFMMLARAERVAEGPPLKTILLDALRRSPADGFSPRSEGRICNRAARISCD